MDFNRKIVLAAVALVLVAHQGVLLGNVEENRIDDFDMKIGLTKQEFLVGEPVILKLQAKNLSNTPIGVLDFRGDYFQLTVKDSKGKALKNKRDNWGVGMNPLRKLSVGGVFNDVTYLDKYFTFPGPGEYTLTYDGSLLVRKDGEGDKPLITKPIPVSGTVKVRLRQGTPVELEKVLELHVKELANKNSKLQRQAVRAFAYVDPEIATRLLKEALDLNEAKSLPYAYEIIKALGKVGSEEAVEVLLKKTRESKIRSIRTGAVRALGKGHFSQSVPQLIELLTDEDKNIKIAALNALGNIKDNRAVEPVKEMVSHQDKRVRKAAERAVANIEKGKKSRSN